MTKNQSNPQDDHIVFGKDDNFDKVMRENALLWTLNNIVLPRGVRWSFTGERSWQSALFLDNSKEIITRKNVQTGLSTTTLCKILHFMYYHPVNVMYTLPRRDDVTDFVDIYVDPIVNASPFLSMIRRMESSGSKVVDNRRIKGFTTEDGSQSFLIFMEATVEPRMIPVDVLINDEIDRSDSNNIEIFQGRTENSIWKIKYKFSTPSIEGYGIDIYFKNSTQNYWHVKCPRCNHWNRLDWAQNMREPGLKIGPHLACARCDRPITPLEVTLGQWASTGSTGELVPTGYQISSLLLPYSRPIEMLWNRYKTAKRLKNFYNLDLGLPYAAPAGSITLDMLKEKCLREKYRMELSAEMHSSPRYVGIDQGNDLYVVAAKAEEGKLKFVYASRLPYNQRDAEATDSAGFPRATAIVRKFNNATTLIDAEPNTHSARDLQGQFEKGQVYLGKYANISGELKINKDEGYLTMSKTEMWDSLREDIRKGNVLFWNDGDYIDPLVLLIFDHFQNVKRDEEVVKTQRGEEVVGVWKGVGPDHFAHAALYCYIAWKYLSASRFTVSIVGITEKEIQEAMEEARKRDGDITQFLDEAQQEALRISTASAAHDFGGSELSRVIRMS